MRNPPPWRWVNGGKDYGLYEAMMVDMSVLPQAALRLHGVTTPEPP